MLGINFKVLQYRKKKKDTIEENPVLVTELTNVATNMLNLF